jgi:hypothetical protein
MTVVITGIQVSNSAVPSVARPYRVTFTINDLEEEKIFEVEDIIVGTNTINLVTCDEKFWWQFDDGPRFSVRISRIVRRVDKGEEIAFPVVLEPEPRVRR